MNANWHNSFQVQVQRDDKDCHAYIRSCLFAQRR